MNYSLQRNELFSLFCYCYLFILLKKKTEVVLSKIVQQAIHVNLREYHGLVSISRSEDKNNVGITVYIYIYIHTYIYIHIYLFSSLFTQRNNFLILFNSTEIRLSIPFSD